MPYLLLRESYIHGRCLIDGLPHNEVRLITDKASAETNWRDEKSRRMEFNTPAYNLFNVLEQIGYKVVTSAAFVTGQKKFDTKDYIWTLHKCDYET